MVNTFLVSEDYRVSASLIDNTRLWKQVLEAWQILRVLQQAHLIAKWRGWPQCPTAISSNSDPKLVAENYLERCKWLSTIRSQYLSTNQRYTILEGKIGTCTTENIPYRADKYYVYGDHVHIWVPNRDLNKVSSRVLDPSSCGCYGPPPDFLKTRSKTRTLLVLHRLNVSIGEDRVFNLGYAQHPVTAMWIGHELSLINYINIHRKECLHRGINASELDIPDIQGSIEPPWWISCTRQIFYSHCASLYRKDPIHYRSLLPYVIDLNSEYIWPPKLTVQEIYNLIHKPVILED